MRRLVFVLLLVSGMALPLSAAEPAPAWWAFQPIKQPPPPKLSPSANSWVRNPIDAFILAKLNEKQFTPAPEADRRTLIRRLYFDLIGLPPTPEAVKEFELDTRPDAYERLVETLLASTHYGERWARHWMDIVHFGETHGHDQDRIRPHAWRYRDYLIEAFNSDRPYSEFVQEQIAVDVLFPEMTNRIPALGFLAAGPWDESSLRDIREDTIDRQIGYYLDRDDVVSTVMGTFQSLTVHCARCHDHKFDPIAQEDYYALQAVFAGIGRGNLSFDADPKTGQKREILRKTLQSIEAKKASLLKQLESQEFRQELIVWEKQQGEGIKQWTLIDPITAISTQGSTLSKQPDGSIRSEGKRPERDTYAITWRTKLSNLTGLRLEVLTDDTLPHHGPGRQDNGNLHLSEFRVQVSSLKDGKAETPRSIVIRRSLADYDQPGWTIAHSIDGIATTAWGIYPQVGKPHHALFAFSEAVGTGEEIELTIHLDQLHGAGHLIGRFRLAATTSKLASLDHQPSPQLESLLAVPAEKRTPAQWQDLGWVYLREKTQAELATLPATNLVYGAAKEFEIDGGHRPVAMPRTVHLLKRGDIRKPQAEASPGTISCLPELPSRFTLPAPSPEGARRAALAQWITRKDNPLTWRSIVNRVWHFHFGKGLVDSPSDFGKMGSLPSHPELLDYLASRFIEQGGSVKELHRLIVTSAVYRQSSHNQAEFAAKDADNRFLWRMPRTRLDAEQVRDSMLMLSGRLDGRMNGPSDQQFSLKPGPHVTPIIDYTKFDWNRPTGHRRSVYRFIFRTLPDPLVDCLDGADASQPTPVRNSSVTALQALSLMNSDFVLASSEAFAKNLSQRSNKIEEQIDLACRSVWGRLPRAEERIDFRRYVDQHGLANFCRVLLNSNEFLFVN